MTVSGRFVLFLARADNLDESFPRVSSAEETGGEGIRHRALPGLDR